MDITTWMPYQGEHEQAMYDVRTSDGIEYYHCWPKDGNFLCTTRDRPVLAGDDVTHVRFSSQLD